MRINNKILLGFTALSLLAGLSVHANRAVFRSSIVTDSTFVDDTASMQRMASGQTGLAVNPASVVDEVVWVVGDEPILKSDVEVMRLQGLAEGITFSGDPDCSIPEQIAVQKLFLHQAAIDSIEVSESEVAQGIEGQINSWIQMTGSREKLEDYLLQYGEKVHFLS